MTAHSDNFPSTEDHHQKAVIHPLPETSNGPVKPFRPWQSRAILPQRPTAAFAGGGFAPPMPRMRPGTSASSSRARKAAKVSFQVLALSGTTRRPGKDKTERLG